MLNLDKIHKEKPIEELLRFAIINLDKPTGPTSFQVSDHVRKLLGVNKTSHFGTLDPMVSGVLPIGLGRACRLNEYFMHRDKEYVGIMRLHEEVADSRLHLVIDQFIGKITQLPPIRSRVKRAERIREVKQFKILERNGKDILFHTIVEAGTYIRKLVHDMGELLGGAHMLELRRNRAGMFDESTICTLYDLDKAIEAYHNKDETLLRVLLVPGESVIHLLPTFEVTSVALKKCLTGSPIFKSFIPLKNTKKLEIGDKIAIICNEIFIGCYRIVNEGEVVAVPEFVYN